MKEKIGGLRKWSKGGARLATTAVQERGLRKLQGKRNWAFWPDPFSLASSFIKGCDR